MREAAMPRNISFALTTQQFKDRTKTVTRRLGWDFLKSGDVLCGVEKAMGLKKGEKIKCLGLIRVVSAWPEPLEAITPTEVRKEGFPDWTPEQFVEFYCTHNKVTPDIIVNRIEYEYLDWGHDKNYIACGHLPDGNHHRAFPVVCAACH